MALVFQGNLNNGSAVIDGVTDTSALAVGMQLVADGITNGSKIISKKRNVSVTMSLPATLTVANQDIVVGKAKRASFTANSETAAQALNLKAITVLRAKITANSSASGPNLNLRSVLVQRGKFDATSSAAAEALVVKSVTVFRGKFDTYSEAVVIINIIGGSDTDGMTVGDVINELVALCGYTNRCSAPETAITRALNDLNTSLQTVWNQARDRNYWTNVTLTLTFADGVSSVPLPDDVQNVVGNCRLELTKRPLTIVGTLGEIENFADLYLDGETTTEPVAYHIKRGAQGISGFDSALCTLIVTPEVQGDALNILLDVVKEAPRYSKYDIENGPVIPIPHSYTETLLLPIARYHMSGSHFFRNQENKPTLEREFQRAMILLGEADPLPGKSGDNRKETAA